MIAHPARAVEHKRCVGIQFWEILRHMHLDGGATVTGDLGHNAVVAARVCWPGSSSPTDALPSLSHRAGSRSAGLERRTAPC